MWMRSGSSEKGQALVLLAIMMIGLLAMLALILDGGNLLTKRRGAQNAADAGALAGARMLCIPPEGLTTEAQIVTNARNTAIDYATLYNEADAAVASASYSDYKMTVTATITTDTFFLHILGRSNLTAQASAAAGCYTPTSAKVLPIAWVCKRTPVGEGGGYAEDPEECVYDIITVEEAKDKTTNPDPNPGDGVPEIHPELYILMNSNAQPDDLNAWCSETTDGGVLTCDLDGDGDLELSAHGDRSWLDLDGGGGGADELRDWIHEGYYDEDIYKHTWISGESGTETSVFHAAGEHVGEVVAVPIFDMICDQEPALDDPYCFPGGIHPSPPEKVISGAGGNYYYHIIGFAAFYISCVDANPFGPCHGHDYVAGEGIIANNTKTIEGYFVSGTLPNMGGVPINSGIDIGVYNIFLIK